MRPAFVGFPAPVPNPPGGLPNARWLREGLLTSGQPEESAFPVLAAAGCGAVLNLLPPGQERTDEEDRVLDLGMDYRVVPVVWLDPRPRDFARFQSVLADWRDRNVLVHCAANYRVSAFFHILRTKVEGVDASVSAAVLRDVWEPNPVWRDYLDRMGAPLPGVGAPPAG